MRQFQRIWPESDLSDVISVLNRSHDTVATRFGFTRETNPSNNAFIDAETLRAQLENGVHLYLMEEDGVPLGCVAIEKSTKEPDTFYIEKVSVVPRYRNKGLGVELMNFATSLIADQGGVHVGIALIDSFEELKQWYVKQGFRETGTKDFPHLPFRVCFMSKTV